MSEDAIKDEKTVVEEPDLSKIQMDRCTPIAKELLKTLAEGELAMGNFKKEELVEKYDSVVKSALEVFKRENVQLQDSTLILQLMLQPLDFVVNGVKQAIQLSFNKAQEKKWGKPLDEIDFDELDKILKS